MNRIVKASSIVIALMAVPVALAAEPPACQVRLLVSNTKGDRPVVLTNPSLTVRQGEPASITVTGGGKTYSFDVLVSVQNGKLAAEVKAKLTHGQQLITAPHITAVVGEPAGLIIGELKFDVDAQLVKAGA